MILAGRLSFLATCLQVWQSFYRASFDVDIISNCTLLTGKKNADYIKMPIKDWLTVPNLEFGMSQSSHVYQWIFSCNIELLRKERDFLKRWRACSDEKNSGMLLFIIFTFIFQSRKSRNSFPKRSPIFGEWPSPRSDWWMQTFLPTRRRSINWTLNHVITKSSDNSKKILNNKIA